MYTDITEKAMLVSLNIRQWSARKHDKHVSQQVNAQYGSNGDAGRFNKVLATKEALKEIQTAVSAARTFHMEQTLPWGENGERLLPSRNYNDYSRRMRELKYEVVEHMVDRLSDPDAIFRDSLIGNMVKLTELLPKLNLYDDPRLETMRRRIEASLCSYSPDQLRKDKTVRQQAATEAWDVLTDMAGYMEAA